MQSSQVLQKISQILVLWFGASMVLQGYLSLGQLLHSELFLVTLLNLS